MYETHTKARRDTMIIAIVIGGLRQCVFEIPGAAGSW